MINEEEEHDDEFEIGMLYEFMCVPDEGSMLAVPLPWYRENSEAGKAECLDGLSDAAGALFVLLRRWFDVAPTYTLNLSSIAPVEEWRNSTGGAALAMRRLQALHHVAVTDTPTTSLVVVGLIYATVPMLLEAHRRHIEHIGATWDADEELHALLRGDLDHIAPRNATDPDPELDDFYAAFKQLVIVMHRTAELSAGYCVILR